MSPLHLQPVAVCVHLGAHEKWCQMLHGQPESRVFGSESIGEASDIEFCCRIDCHQWQRL